MSGLLSYGSPASMAPQTVSRLDPRSDGSSWLRRWSPSSAGSHRRGPKMLSFHTPNGMDRERDWFEPSVCLPFGPRASSDSVHPASGMAAASWSPSSPAGLVHGIEVASSQV